MESNIIRMVMLICCALAVGSLLRRAGLVLAFLIGSFYIYDLLARKYSLTEAPAFRQLWHAFSTLGQGGVQLLSFVMNLHVAYIGAVIISLLLGFFLIPREG